MEEIDLKELIEIFWEKRTTIILLVAIFMVVGFIYSSFMITPKYSSTTSLVLAQSNSTDQTGITTTDITLNSKLISTYSKLVKSDLVIKEVISNLGISDSIESVKSSVTVSAVSDTEILEIKVTTGEPDKSAKLANEVSAVFIEKVKELYSRDNVHTLDPAEIEEAPSNINHPKTIIIFALVGFVIAAGYIFAVFMLDNSIKTPEDVEKSAHVPVLASIPLYDDGTNKAKTKISNKRNPKGGKRK